MPRSLRELTEDAEASGNWDAVADWCENFDWSEAEEIPVAEHYLRCAAATRPQDEAKLIAAVSAARTAGTPWPRIAKILNASPQAVQEQYAPLIEAAAANQ
ncbi:MAG: hypothetical protein F4003_08880 [Acidimicrobiaceae bacterium]|nr:hypothetical protein [Acidimicrobiaceae bacterium]MYC41017.1 hypothetical protein [Acidimicrobiaceae bacterium]